jgi:excinuclease ABC subunit B
MKEFKIDSAFSPMGDQPKAIEELCSGVERGDKFQCLLGVTGSGKTFTIANVIQKLQKPTLILTHNKTLTAQLYGEFKQFFPENSVEYFVSYYDYYQPEAYVVSTDTFIEKDLAINDEIDKLRLRATSQLLSGRRDIVVVASVSCIYGMGNPEDYKNGIIKLAVGQRITRNSLLYKLVDALYSRTEMQLERGNFRVKGDTVDICLPYTDHGIRISFFGDEIEEIHRINTDSGKTFEQLDQIAIFPANLYIAPKDRLIEIIRNIEDELQEQLKYMEADGKYAEAKRLRERVEMDLEMMRQLGYCSGVENYSRFFDGRKPGARPFCLIDYFPDDFLMVIDESHVTLPQFRGMYGGDRSRKTTLVEYGFRLPSALDNRPLNFLEFETLMNQVVFVSATPADYELEKTDGVIVEQIVRPTGLLDPLVDVRPSINQVDDLLDEIRNAVKKGERILVTTITKRMSEELAKFMAKLNIRCRYIHSDIDTLERVEILRDLRLGEFDVLIGINLLREGLDLPEVALVAILDADKEGFLRNEKSLTQTAGRAARNSEGRVILYADKITPSMQKMMDETNRRRSIQVEYNLKHNITPTTVFKSREEIIKQSSVLEIRKGKIVQDEDSDRISVAADPIVQYMTKDQLAKAVNEANRLMKKAAKDMDFMTAAQYRDEMFSLKTLLKEKFDTEI